MLAVDGKQTFVKTTNATSGAWGQFGNVIE